MNFAKIQHCAPKNAEKHAPTEVIVLSSSPDERHPAKSKSGCQVFSQNNRNKQNHSSKSYDRKAVMYWISMNNIPSLIVLYLLQHLLLKRKIIAINIRKFGHIVVTIICGNTVVAFQNLAAWFNYQTILLENGEGALKV